MLIHPAIFGSRRLNIHPSIISTMAPHRQHAWERVGPPLDVRHAWEWDEPDDDLDTSDEEWNPEFNTAAATQMMVDSLFELYCTSDIGAERFCVIMYWAMKAELEGMVKRYAKKPGTGHYQRFLDNILGMKTMKGKLMDIAVAGHRKGDLSRSKVDVKAKPVY